MDGHLCTELRHKIVKIIVLSSSEPQSLEALSLVEAGLHEITKQYMCNEAELIDAHHLDYNRYDTLDAAAPAPPAPPCLRSRVRRINLVHYQGGRARRTLTKFLLRNAPVLQMLYCGFAEGLPWIQTELMREMKSWVVSENANTEFR